MEIKFLVDEDCANYRKISMFIGFPNCTWKCDKMNCQNSSLAELPNIEITKEELCERYLNNPLTNAIVCGGLEPFDSELDLISFVDCLRNRYHCDDDIVIYTGYTEEELSTGRRLNNTTPELHQNLFNSLIQFNNIIIKYGRYIPDDVMRYEPILGINLASSNQYAKEYRK